MIVNIRYCFLIIALTLSYSVKGDYLVVSRSANLYEFPDKNSKLIEKCQEGDLLQLLLLTQENGYFYALNVGSQKSGWIYRTLVRRYPGDISGSTFDHSGPIINKQGAYDFILPNLPPKVTKVVQAGYVSYMSEEYNIPLMVINHLTNDVLSVNKYNKRPSGYPRDIQFSALKSSALSGTGYDHGHMSPAADYTSDSSLYVQSFLMSNIAPQHACLNQKGWLTLEMHIRQWVETNDNSDFYIITGSNHTQFIDTICLPSNVTVFVPASFYKIIIEVRNDRLIRTAAFVMPNASVDGMDLPSYRVSIDEIESLTNFNFLSSLNSVQEAKFENIFFEYPFYISIATQDAKNCNSIYNSSRIYPSDRTKWKCND